MQEMFDSLNAYDSIQAIYAQSPEELCNLLRQIKTPFKIVSIVQVKDRAYAYIMGDVRIKKVKRKDNNNGNSNS